MASKKFDAGTSQSVTTDELFVKTVHLVAGPANDATCVIYSNTSTVEIKLAAAKGTTSSFRLTGSTSVASAPVPGPVVIDVVGTGAWARIDF